MSGRIKESLFNTVVSIFYIGYLPKGGGSVAALSAILLYLAIYKNIPIYLTALILIIGIGTVLADFSEKIFKTKDPTEFVIDDFAGMLVALTFVPSKPLFIIAGFLFFRFCDIVKIFPIKRIEALKGGWGIMLDDIVAGLYANLFVQVFLRRFAS